MKAKDILDYAGKLVNGDRQNIYGDPAECHEKIAIMLSAFLQIRRAPSLTLTKEDAAIIMALVKIARTQVGAFNADDYVDGAAYLGIAGEIASRDSVHRNDT